MGLDMYLTKKYYVKNWNHMSKDELHKITILKGGEPSTIPADKIKNIECEMMYWRKANAIHKWFVDNVQDGKDDCGEYYVSREKLAELLNICNTVLEKSKVADGKVHNGTTVAQEFLPTTSGFFFGGTDYDEYYIQGVEYTAKELTKILAIPKDGGEFYYSSSW